VTVRDDPAVTVGVDRLAADSRLADKVSQRQPALLPTAPWGSVRDEAFLAIFGDVNTVEPDPLAVDLDGVGIDDGGPACDLLAE
jgi:hypothetical protein